MTTEVPRERRENCSMHPVRIELLNGKTARTSLPGLGGLLIDAVRNGASVGFVLLLANGEVEAYWHKVCGDVTAGHRLLFAAFDDGGRLVGSAQLALEPRANGRMICKLTATAHGANSAQSPRR